MTFKYRAEIYGALTQMPETIYGCATGDSYKDVMATIEDYYGSDLENIFLEAMTDNSIIELNEEMYNKLSDYNQWV